MLVCKPSHIRPCHYGSALCVSGETHPCSACCPATQVEAGRLNGRPCQLVATETSHAEGPRLLYIIQRWLPLVLHIRRELGVKRLSGDGCMLLCGSLHYRTDVLQSAASCTGRSCWQPTSCRLPMPPPASPPSCSSGAGLCAGTSQPTAHPAAGLPSPAALLAAAWRAGIGWSAACTDAAGTAAAAAAAACSHGRGWRLVGASQL